MNNLLISFLFVALYGSGFVAAKLGLPYAAPVPFLAFRFLITGVILAIFCFVMKTPKPMSIKEFLHACIAGLLLIGTFSLGVFVSIDLGTSPATSSLIISFQPLLVGLFSHFIWKNTVSRSQWIGLLLGLTGITFIVFNQLGHTPLIGFFMSIVGLLGLTLGSLYQKRFCSNLNIFTNGMIHSLSSSVLCFLILPFVKSNVIWAPQFIGALLWMSIGVSICALSLLYLLIKRIPISQVASLFYLMPVSTLFFSVIFFKDHLNLLNSIGILVTASAIFLVNRVKTIEKLMPAKNV